jgi:hypothetical protein
MEEQPETAIAAATKINLDMATFPTIYWMFAFCRPERHAPRISGLGDFGLW